MKIARNKPVNFMLFYTSSLELRDIFCLRHTGRNYRETHRHKGFHFHPTTSVYTTDPSENVTLGSYLLQVPLLCQLTLNENIT